MQVLTVSKHGKRPQLIKQCIFEFLFNNNYITIWKMLKLLHLPLADESVTASCVGQ